MGIPELLRDRHQDVLRIATEHGATRISIFGSAARGEATEKSDLDVLVRMKPGSSLLDIIAIKQDLEDLLGHTVDIVTEESLSPYIRDSVLKEAVNL